MIKIRIKIDDKIREVSVIEEKCRYRKCFIPYFAEGKYYACRINEIKGCPMNKDR